MAGAGARSTQTLNGTPMQVCAIAVVLFPGKRLAPPSRRKTYWSSITSMDALSRSSRLIDFVTPAANRPSMVPLPRFGGGIVADLDVRVCAGGRARVRRNKTRGGDRLVGPTLIRIWSSIKMYSTDALQHYVSFQISTIFFFNLYTFPIFSLFFLLPWLSTFLRSFSDFKSHIKQSLHFHFIHT